MIESKGVVIHSSGNIIASHLFRCIMGEEKTLQERITALESRLTKLTDLCKSQQFVLEILMQEAQKNSRQNPDCAVDPTGEWY